MGIQRINIGTEGNDATGDSIREAFRKTNDNFTELYTSLGLGDRLLFSDLTDGGGSYDDQGGKLVTVKKDETGLQYLPIVGKNGISVSVDPVGEDAGKVVVAATAVRLINDVTPQLGGNLNASFLKVYNLADPEEPRDAVNRRSAVLKAGDTMTGDLILKRDPVSADDVANDGLIAATKRYVDTSSYVSIVNFYVSTSGLDARSDIPEERKGRAIAYAFRSVQKACQKAEDIIEATPLELGPYQKIFTYNSGIDECTITQINNNGDGTKTLLMFTNGLKIDQGNDISEGLYVRGNSSGAFAKIVQHDGTLQGDDELIRVEIDRGTFLPGESVSYAAAVKNIQITIFVETGIYYENFPIKIPENTSLQGDELRRTIIRPLPGVSASSWNGVHFRRDQTFDGLTLSDRTFGYHYLTDTSQPVYPVVNYGGHVKAGQLLFLNKAFIQNEVIAYLDETFSTYTFSYDESYAVDYIIKAAIDDMALGTNYKSREAARRWLDNYPTATTLKRAQVVTGVNRAKFLCLGQITGNSDAVDILGENFNIIIRMINNGITNQPAVTFTNPTGIAAGFLNAKNLIAGNKEFIKQETVAWIAANYTIGTIPNYNATKTAKDVEYVVDSIIYDLIYGGDSASIDIAISYFSGLFSRIPGQEEVYKNALARTKELLELISTNTPVLDRITLTPAQVTGAAGSGAAALRVGELMDIIIDAIDDGTAPARSSATPTSASISRPDLVSARTTINTNINTTIGDVVDYLTERYTGTFVYDRDICFRDVGMILDSMIGDLRRGSGDRSIAAGLSYFKASAALVISDQLFETTQAIRQIEILAENVIGNDLIPTANLYQTEVPQVINNSLVAETGSMAAISSLTDAIVGIINNDIDYNPPKNNDEVDVFLVNDATILRNMTIQGHGGFVMAFDPAGQIRTKSPYCQTCSSISGSTNKQRFAGGQFADGFVGNLQTTVDLVAPRSQFTIPIKNLVRNPQTPCSFVHLGKSYQVNTVSSYNAVAKTAVLNLDEKTPFVESGLNPIPASIELITAGNRSMLSNDFTQINDLGYGLVATNNGIMEAVSVFTYYCYTAYYSLNGGQIRSLNGSCAYGVNALKAEGSDPLEVPDIVQLKYDLVNVGKVFDPVVMVLNATTTGAVGSTVTQSGTGASGVMVAKSADNKTISFRTITGTFSVDNAAQTLSFNGIPSAVYPDTITRPFEAAEAGLVVNVDYLNIDHVPTNGSELEVTFIDDDGLKVVYRYEIASASKVIGVNNDVVAVNPYTVYKLNLAGGSGGAVSTASTGLFKALANQQNVTIRQNRTLWLQNLDAIVSVRPSTALIMNEQSNVVYRVLSFSFVGAKVGTFSWSGTSATIVSPGHGLNNGDDILLAFTAGTQGNPPTTLYEVTVVNTSTFTVVIGSSPLNTSTGSVSFTTTVSEGLANLRESFDQIQINDFNPTETDPYPTTSGAAGVGRPAAGGTGNTAIACVPLSTIDQGRAVGMKFAWDGVVHTITQYVTPIELAKPYGLVIFTPGLASPFQRDLGGFAGINTARATLAANAVGEVSVNISTMRATGHDMLNIGTGSYADSNYPNNIFGPPVNAAASSKEVQEIGKGRVFYVTTDQDGNFKVGEFFKVDQGTGTVTFAASIALSNLDGIGFKRGVAISEFSTDDTMKDNAADTVPTEQAVRGYIDRRLGITHNVGITPEPALIGPGFLPRNGLLSMTASLGMGSNRIVDLGDPTGLTDAINVRSLGFELFRSFNPWDFNLAGVRQNNVKVNAGDLVVMTGNDQDFMNAKVVGDISSSVDSTTNNVALTINPLSVTNAMISDGVDNRIVQSKLNLLNAAAGINTGLTPAAKGIASFSNTNFDSALGHISIKSQGVPKSALVNVAAKSAIANNTVSSGTPTDVSFVDLVSAGKGIQKSDFSSVGAMTVTAVTGGEASGLGITAISSNSGQTAGLLNTLVQRDAQGNFEAKIATLTQISLTTTNRSLASAQVVLAGQQLGPTGNEASIGQHVVYRWNGSAGIKLGAGTGQNQNIYLNDEHIFKTASDAEGGIVTCGTLKGPLVVNNIQGKWELATGASFEATYADLAEYYTSDQDYEAGTVVMFGGEQEVTAANEENTFRVAGVVSTNPAYTMNVKVEGTRACIALQGRVPTKVVGRIRKGDLMVASNIVGVATSRENARIGSVIGKALQDYDSEEVGIIEVAVGRL